MTYLYKDTKTWNPFKGCRFKCDYCKKSFQLQAKRQKHNCMKCYNYEPHFHPERLDKIPKANLVFTCANGDISFANREQKASILKAMLLKPKQTFLLQTKAPYCFDDWRIPSNVIVGTTIETNRDTKSISKAPITERRFRWLRNLVCRKAVTIEPIPEIVWVGYCNHNKNNKLNLDEPELSKTKELISELERFTDVRLKTIRESNRK